jgi:hypothetical protein
MTPKWKTFAIWLALPYLLYETVVPGMILLRRPDVSLADMYRLRSLATALATCASLAAFGTIAIWLLPIRRAWLGAITGLILAIVGITLWALFEMTFWGGFEENVDICMTAFSLMAPSCLAGAYAGFLRSKESRPRESAATPTCAT